MWAASRRLLPDRAEGRRMAPMMPPEAMIHTAIHTTVHTLTTMMLSLFFRSRERGSSQVDPDPDPDPDSPSLRPLTSSARRRERQASQAASDPSISLAPSRHWDLSSARKGLASRPADLTAAATDVRPHADPDPDPDDPSPDPIGAPLADLLCSPQSSLSHIRIRALRCSGPAAAAAARWAAASVPGWSSETAVA